MQLHCSGSNLLPLNLVLHSLNSVVRRTKALPYVILSGKGEAFEVEGSDLYITRLFQKILQNTFTIAVTLSGRAEGSVVEWV